MISRNRGSNSPINFDDHCEKKQKMVFYNIERNFAANIFSFALLLLKLMPYYILFNKNNKQKMQKF